MPPSEFPFNPVPLSTPPPPPPARPNWRRWAAIVGAGMVVLTGVGVGASLVLSKALTPKASPTPSPAPAVTSTERSQTKDNPLANTQLQAPTLTAGSGDITTLVVKALQVNQSAQIGGDLTVTGNGAFGGNVTAANFNGNGAGLTNVDA